jgi:hypothetical protein
MFLLHTRAAGANGNGFGVLRLSSKKKPDGTQSGSSKQSAAGHRRAQMNHGNARR